VNPASQVAYTAPSKAKKLHTQLHTG